ncbi:GNAT family N-acetyltransferase [Bacillus sp. Marseille-Q3570]|uniref:GNAT family N-acetyltransferase n=1 Tax=Bacillus sp. Marseille-Q3570 TaxID=2963522 RepID=UPI0021B8083B|nr:GNAT family N-acetyltransferase [Bacillus sp. Marseille-Q3570]
MDFTIVIDNMKPDDWDQVRKIYKEGIDTGHATFETEVPPYEKWEHTHRRECRFVARSGKDVLGWAALSPVSGRCVYSGVAEVSVYVCQKNKGKGIGHQLLDTLVKCSENHGIWTLQAGIFPENMASITLHKKAGFREVGRRERLGKMAGKWRDVILLERRSEAVGIE